MNSSISVSFGTPIHGWLPVDFHCMDIHLLFDASNALNNPIEELENTITKLDENNSGKVTWWLEPGAYIFYFTRKGEDITLEVFETADLHNAKAKEELILTITTYYKQITKPFRAALRQFHSTEYEEKHW